MAFTITAGNDDTTVLFYDRLKLAFLQGEEAFAIKPHLKLKMELKKGNDCVVIRLSTKRLFTEEEFCEVRKILARTIYQFIQELLEEEYLTRILFSLYPDLSHTEKKMVWKILLQEKNQYWEYQKAQRILSTVSESLFVYLENAKHLNITGFLRFRLPEYSQTLHLVMDRAVEKMLIEKEYQSFIALIQAFILTQKSKIHLVHVVWQKDNHSFQLLDHLYLPLEQDLWQLPDGFAASGAQDDVLISSLLYLLPEKIILHTGCQQEAPKIALTIQKIFSGRTILCAGCKVCRGALEKSEK